MGKIFQKSAHQSQKSVQYSWVDPVYSSIIFKFFKEGNIDRAFLEGGPSLHKGFLTSNENKRICNEYDDCIILFYDCTFLVMGLPIYFLAPSR